MLKIRRIAAKDTLYIEPDHRRISEIMAVKKSRKVSISLSSGLYNALSQWAGKEGSTATSLAAELISTSIREEVRLGRLTYSEGENPDIEDETKT